MQHKSAKYLKVLGPNSGQSGHVSFAAHGHPNDPEVGGCAALFAVVEEPNGQLGPTPTRARVGIPAYNSGEGPALINAVNQWWTRLNAAGQGVHGPTPATSWWVGHSHGRPQL